MNRAATILTLLLLLMPPLWAQTGLKFSPASKPQITVLGVFHLVSTKNMFTQQQGDTLTDKRQREIEQVVERLKAFHPTKIAVEHGDDGKLNERYQQYLSDKSQFVAVHMFFIITPEDLQDPAVARPKDIVLDLRCPFAVEMIISEHALQLAEFPTRLNHVVRNYTSVRPIITIEAFEMTDNTMPTERYPPLQRYELGKNWLFGERGRLP